LKKFINNYQSHVHGNLTLKAKEINDYMKEYDMNVKKEEDLIQAFKGNKDEDGWKKVVASKDKRHLPPLHESELKGKRKKNKDQMMVSFYKFQKIEKKKESNY
jgi:hypothetical protein